MLTPGGESLGLARMIPLLVAEDGFADPSEAARAIRDYEQFFHRAATGPAEPLVPTVAADRVWQRHLLETPAYLRDCRRWAGTYLHRDRVAFAPAGDRDGSIWEQPGPAFVHRGSVGLVVGPRSDDLLALVPLVRESLRTHAPGPVWVGEARDLLQTDPESALREYRRFVELLVNEPDALTPCRLVDEFWHQHVLDSRIYVRFCARVAGRYLHHRPTYDQPIRVHAPRFARTRACYRSRFGEAPPEPTWTHMAESGGGGEPSGPPGPPLYAINTHDRVQAVLKVRAVDRGFPRQPHRVLLRKGVTPELWCALKEAVNTVPRVRWSARKESRPEVRDARNQRITITLIPAIFVLGMVACGFWARVDIPIGFAVGVVLVTVFVTLPLLFQAIEPDEDAARRVLTRFGPVFGGLGVTLTYRGVGPEMAVVVDATLSDSEMIFWEDDGPTGPSPYVIDRPDRVRILVPFGRVKPAHRREVHPVLSRLGLTRADWDGFLDVVDHPIRYSSAEYARLRPNPALRSAIRSFLVTVAIFGGLHALALAYPARSGPVPRPLVEVVANLLGGGAVVGLVASAIRWAWRPIDLKATQMAVAQFVPWFQKLGIGLEFDDDLGAVRVDASLGNPTQARPWEPGEKPTPESLQEQQRQQEQADRDAAKVQARQKREKERVRRRIERDEAYRDQGIKPGPWAWFQSLPELQQTALVGLALGVSAALILVGIALIWLRR